MPLQPFMQALDERRISTYSATFLNRMERLNNERFNRPGAEGIAGLNRIRKCGEIGGRIWHDVRVVGAFFGAELSIRPDNEIACSRNLYGHHQFQSIPICGGNQ